MESISDFHRRTMNDALLYQTEMLIKFPIISYVKTVIIYEQCHQVQNGARITVNDNYPRCLYKREYRVPERWIFMMQNTSWHTIKHILSYCFEVWCILKKY